MIRIIIAIIFIIVLLYLYNKYHPQIDIILSNNKYVVIIWYYIKDNNGNYELKVHIADVSYYVNVVLRL